MKKQNQTYTPEFLAEAAKMVLEQRHAQEEVAKRLGIPKGTLAGWIAATRSPKVSAALGACSVAELQAENTQLRRELAEARMERDIFKKRRRTLPRSHCQVRVHESVATPVSRQGHEPGV